LESVSEFSLDSFLQLVTAASAEAIHQLNVVELFSYRVNK
jgi:hypothetical protein